MVPWDIEEEDCTGGRMKYGTLEFDFVSANVKPRITGQPPINSRIFRLLLHELQRIRTRVVNANPPKKKRNTAKLVKKKGGGGSGNRLNPILPAEQKGRGRRCAPFHVFRFPLQR